MYVIIVYNKSSPDFMALPYHGFIGTGTIECMYKDKAICVLKEYIENYPDIKYITVRGTDLFMKPDTTYYWERNRDGSTLPNL